MTGRQDREYLLGSVALHILELRQPVHRARRLAPRGEAFAVELSPERVFLLVRGRFLGCEQRQRLLNTALVD